MHDAWTKQPETDRTCVVNLLKEIKSDAEVITEVEALLHMDDVGFVALVQLSQAL